MSASWRFFNLLIVRLFVEASAKVPSVSVGLFTLLTPQAFWALCCYIVNSSAFYSVCMCAVLSSCNYELYNKLCNFTVVICWKETYMG